MNLFVNIVDVKIRKVRRIYFTLFGIFCVGRKSTVIIIVMKTRKDDIDIGVTYKFSL